MSSYALFYIIQSGFHLLQDVEGAESRRRTTRPRSAGATAACTSLRRRQSPCWKQRVQGPTNRSLFLGYVGSERCACVTSANLAASGLTSIAQGQPNRCVFEISPTRVQGGNRRCVRSEVSINQFYSESNHNDQTKTSE